MPRGADGIVLALKEAGVSTIFGIPSIHNIGLYESLRHEPSIRHIGCRHEAGATHMATAMPGRAADWALLSRPPVRARALRFRPCRKPGAVARRS